MSLKIAATTAVFSFKVAILFFLRQCSWSKTVREQLRPFLELTRVVESALAKALLN